MELIVKFICVWGLFISTNVFAYSDDYIACMKSASNQVKDMKKCQINEFNAQDKLANSNFKKLVSGVEESQRELLENSQKKWLSQRKSACSMKSENIKNLAFAQMNCAVHITASRAEMLEVQLRNKNLL